MKTRLIYLFLALTGLNFQGTKVIVTKWVIMNGCSLKVDGSTNINNFSCYILNYNRPDTIFVSRGTNQVQLNGSIQLDVENFDCHNRIMTADLRKTLRSKEFPKLGIFFASMNKYPDAAGSAKGLVVISLAGVSKRFEVDYKIVSVQNNIITMEGFRKVNFSDFNIIPPRKLGGMIKTNNELSVTFNLRMQVLQ
jgi:hypothetical protein